MRLIDADALKESLTETLRRCDEWIENAKDEETRTIAESNYTAFLESILRVKEAPTIDAVPATIEGALGYLHKVGWMQEHDRIMTEDAVPVVRCKECKRRKNAKENGRVYWDGYEYYCGIARYGVTDDGFCSYGERKDDD